MSFPAPSAFPDGKIVSDSLPADLWTFLQTSCDFPAKILRISCGGLLQGQADGKGDPVVRAGSPDRPSFKADTFRVMEEEPERLSEVKGISEKMAMAIAQQVEEKKGMREAMMFLQNYGITLNLAA